MSEDFEARLMDAIEGECDGLAITRDQARRILEYVGYPWGLKPIRPFDPDAEEHQFIPSQALFGKCRICGTDR